MDFELSSQEVRVLGALMEKEIATPEYYPLTLNALVNACNQKTSRDPVVEYDEAAVEEALESLRNRRLAATITGAGMRVPKHRETLSETLNLGRREMALICVLMLRGPQTAGELHSRTERLHSFAGIEEVSACLDRLMERQPEPLVARMPRQPGLKEVRYAHLFAGEAPVEAAATPEPSAPREDRLSVLEAEVASLRRELDELKERFAGFSRQFE